jgi:hypothetical protein
MFKFKYRRTFAAFTPRFILLPESKSDGLIEIVAALATLFVSAAYAYAALVH